MDRTGETTLVGSFGISAEEPFGHSPFREPSTGLVSSTGGRGRPSLMLIQFPHHDKVSLLQEDNNGQVCAMWFAQADDWASATQNISKLKHGSRFVLKVFDGFQPPSTLSSMKTDTRRERSLKDSSNIINNSRASACSAIQPYRTASRHTTERKSQSVHIKR